MPRRLHSKIYVLSRYGNSFERFIHQKRTYQIFELRIGIQEFSNVTFDLELVSDTSDIKKIETELSSTIFNLEDSFLFKFKLFKFLN